MSNQQIISRPFELKSIAADGRIEGYASVFGEVDCQGEAVATGAFAKSLKEWKASGRMPPLLWMHDPAEPIGVWTNLYEDATGLVAVGQLAIKTRGGADAYELLKMRAVTGLSIGYRTVASRVDRLRKAKILTEVNLFEVSLVTFPANDQARISAVKHADELRAIVARLHRAARSLMS